MPVAYKWKRDPELERLAKRDPFTAEMRKRQADMWRSAHKKNPAMARLLWRRMQQAERQFAKEVWQ